MTEQEVINPKEQSGDVIDFTRTYRTSLTLNYGFLGRYINVAVTSAMTVTLPAASTIGQFTGFKTWLIVKGGGSTLTIARNSNPVRGCLNHGFTTIVNQDVVLATVSEATRVCLFCDGRVWIVSTDASPASTPLAITLPATLDANAINGTIYLASVSSGAVTSDLTGFAAANRGEVFKLVVTGGGTNTLALTLGAASSVVLLAQTDASAAYIKSTTAATLTLGGSGTGDGLQSTDAAYLISDGTRLYVCGVVMSAAVVA